MRAGETPVPIPNTMVKTCTADGTILETVWESRWLPDYKKEKQNQTETRMGSNKGNIGNCRDRRRV